MKGFIHLHLHSEYSLLDSPLKIGPLIKKVKELNMPAVALTDHGNIMGALKFYKEARENSIIPIIGAELYLAPESRTYKPGKNEINYYHLVVLVKNDKGYRNLSELISLSFTEGFYIKPRIDKEILKRYKDGLVVLSSGTQGEIPHKLLTGREEDAYEAAKWYREILKDDFYIEIQNHGIPEQLAILPKLIELSRDLSIPLVATNDVHYLEREDAELRDVLHCIQTNDVLSNPNRSLKQFTDQMYLKSSEEMQILFADVPESIDTSWEIAAKCSFDFKLGTYFLPEFAVPVETTSDDYFEKICWQGFNRIKESLKNKKNSLEVYEKRLAYEIEEIRKMGFPGYFLIVWDIIKFARDYAIPVGPGRGSVVGSLVAYMMEITSIDPLDYDLIFERFLNPERITAPNIDIDFDSERKDEVIEYIRIKYGEDNVAHVVKIDRMKARLAIRQIGRVLEIPLADVNKLARMIPVGPKVALKNEIDSSKDLQKGIKRIPESKKLIDFALKLENTVRRTTMHAAGVVIAPKNINEFLPLYNTNNDIVTQFEKDEVEEIGLLKMDILGLKTLTIIKNILKEVEDVEGKKIVLETIPLDDEKTFKIFQDGDTDGIFQFESSGIRKYLKRSKPDKIEDLVVLNALYRPGPLISGMAESYISRKMGKEKVTYIFPELQEILGDTYGIPVFHEQIMRIFKVIAGFSFGKADEMRKIMGEKLTYKLPGVKRDFGAGAAKRQFNKKRVDELFLQMINFTGYSYNKSHSIAYALLAYQTAYLKAHYLDYFKKHSGLEKGKILIIDNDSDILGNLEKLFTSYDYEVLHAISGKIGVDKFLEYIPDIVLIDMPLPDKAGDTILKEIKDIRKDVPIIVITAHVDNNVMLRAIQNGAIDFLKKPLSDKDLKYLVNVIERIVIKKVAPGQILADAKEKIARQCLLDGLYSEGRKWLCDAIENDNSRKQRLVEEFGFIYNLDINLEEDEGNRKNEQNRIESRKQIWEYISARNPSKTLKGEEKRKKETLDKKLNKPGTVQSKDVNITSKIIYDESGKTPEQKGKELENDFLKLFRYFLMVCKEEGGEIRRQQSGDQSGYDLKFVFEKKGSKKLKILVECKNYKENITLNNIADKLDEVKAYNPNIDHWILIGPHANVSNKVERILEAWEEKGEYPFGVQLWTKEFMVDDFFGIYPEIYDKYFSPEKGQTHPKDWDEKKKKEVINSWRQKLDPPLKLPGKWKDYLIKPHKLFLTGESKKKFEELFKHGVTMMCKDETGQLLKENLEEKVREWLDRPAEDEPSLILLGEFGDGKTVFTYVFARRLIEEFRQSPATGWIPLRFALKDFGSKDINSSSSFTEKRLKEFGLDLDGWNDLKHSDYKTLIILDGFDEISKKLDPKTVLENIDYLIDCFSNEFSGRKLLITSRKHFFEIQRNKNKLINRIGKPLILELAPINRRTTLNHLEQYAQQENLEEKLNKLKSCHDPIGLASKPLFLEMVKLSLKKLPEDEFSERILYETYIQEALERKSAFLDHDEKDTDQEVIINNIKEILEEVALALHESPEEFVFLSDVRGAPELKRRIWDMSFEDDLISEDEKARVAVRSLLKRVEPGTQQTGNQKWPVDFCHRSMREYFVARAVCNLLSNNLPKCEKYLRNHFLSYEITFFSGEIMKSTNRDYSSLLKDLLNKTRNLSGTEKLKVNPLGCNVVNILYRYKGCLPGDDWANLVLDEANLGGADFSGKDFTGTSLQYANLDNANFINANFSKCNLTGVRLEETSHVQSIAVSEAGSIYASYVDGNIREWFCQAVRRPYSINLNQEQKVKNVKIFPLPGNDIAILHNQFLSFYDKTKDSLQKRASIEIKPNLQLVKLAQSSLLLIEEENSRHFFQLVDLEKQEVLKKKEIQPFSICENIGEKAFVTYDENNGLQIIDVLAEKPKKLKIKDAEEVTCMACIKCKTPKDQYRLAIGQKDGIVRVYTINLSDWEAEQYSPCKKHNKTVKDITFIDPTIVVTGGFDKKILLLKIGDRSRELKLIDELKMNIQCRGMQIDGIIREEERQILQGFMKKDVENKDFI